jgi:hypothetical protein
MSNTVSVAETANSVVVVEADNTVTVTEADNTVIVTAPSNLPFGGATDDLLVKQSATDGDVAWQDEITVDQIDFDTTAAETLTTAGQMAWDADVDTIDVLLRNGTATPTLMHIGQDEYFYVKASAAITRGQVVHYTGTDGNSGHILAAPFLADGTYESKTVIGVATQDADTGEFVHVLWRGKLRSFDTSLLTPGILYASTTVAGGFQSTAPTAPDNIVTVAVAVNQKSNGTLLVRPTFAGSLAESEDVDVSGGLSGNVLGYDGATWNPIDFAPVAFPRYLVQSNALWFGSAATSIANPASVSPPTNSLRFAPIMIPVDCIVNGIAVTVGVAGSAGSTVRLGIYSDSNGVPDSLVVDAGTVGTSSVGVKTISISDETLDAGRWWIAIAGENNTSRLTYDAGVATWLGYNTARIGNAALANFWATTYTPGSLPASVTPSLSEAISRPVGWLSLRTA